MPGHERPPDAPVLSPVPPALVRGELTPLGLLPGSSNAALLARCVEGGDERLAVYKPARGETPLWDFPDGTLHRREVAAFEVARALGWPNVPPTVSLVFSLYVRANAATPSTFSEPTGLLDVSTSTPFSHASSPPRG